MRSASGLILATVIAASGARHAVAQNRTGDILANFESAAAGAGTDAVPTVDEVVGDALRRFQMVDRRSARAMTARLAQTESELRLLSTLLARVKGGLLVDAPGMAHKSDDATPEHLKEETRKVEDLRGRLAASKRDRAVEPAPVIAAVPRAEPRPAQPTAIGSSLLEISVDVPAPPKAGAAVPVTRAAALDPQGLSRALYAAGDYAGAIEAVKQIPEDKRGPEDRYRMARCLDRLGQWGEAEAAYKAVGQADPAGHWGRQAVWMLKLGQSRQSVEEAIKGRSADGTKEKAK